MANITLNDLLIQWNIDSTQLQTNNTQQKKLKEQSQNKKDMYYTGMCITTFAPFAAFCIYESYNNPLPNNTTPILTACISLAAFFALSVFLTMFIARPIVRVFIEPYGTQDAKTAKHININNHKSISIHRPTFQNLYEKYRANLALVRTTYARNPEKHPTLLTTLNEYHDKEPTLDILLDDNVDAILRRLDSQPQFVQLQSFIDSHSEIFNQTT